MTGFFEHQRSGLKRKYLRNLIVLASADGHFDPKETQVLFVIAKKRGLKDWQAKELLAEESLIQIFIPESFGIRMNLLFDLMQIFYADGKIDDSEITFIEKLQVSFDLSREFLMEVVAVFKNGTPDPRAWREFTEILQPVSCPAVRQF